MQTPPWTRVLHLAADNHGVIGRRQAIGLGMAPSTLDDRLRREHARQLATGVWLLPGHRLTWQARLAATILALGSVVAASHHTAMALHGLAGHGLPPTRLEVVVPHGTTARPPAHVVRHRSLHLDGADVVAVRGWPTTTVARTVVDSAARLSSSRLAGLVIEVRQRGLASIDDIRAERRRRPSIPGSGRLRRVLEEIDAHGADSILEVRAREVLERAGIEPTTEPFAIDTPEGRIRVDLAVPGARVAIECDGFAYHGGRTAFEEDRWRWGAISDAGWQVVVTTWSEVTGRPERFVTRVRRAVGRSQRLGVGSPTALPLGDGLAPMSGA